MIRRAMPIDRARRTPIEQRAPKWTKSRKALESPGYLKTWGSKPAYKRVMALQHTVGHLAA